MTRYEYLHHIARIISPKQTEEFFAYLLHACDDNGSFLRTRYCYSDKPLADLGHDHQVKCALITLQKKYDFDNLPAFYDSNGHTNIKLQVHFGEFQKDDTLHMQAAWASSVGFPYQVMTDMEQGTYEILGPQEESSCDDDIAGDSEVCSHNDVCLRHRSKSLKDYI